MDDIMLSGAPSAMDDNQNVTDQGATDANLETEAGKEPEDTSPEPNTDGNNADGEPGKRKKPGGWQRKLARLERELQDRDAELQKLRGGASPAPTEKPKLDDFNSFDEYQEALTDWKVDQKLALREENARKAEEQKTATTKAQEWQNRIDELDDSYDDYHDVTKRAFDPLIARGQFKHFVFEALEEAGPEVVYKVATNAELLQKLPNITPLQFAKEIERIQGSKSQSTPAAKTVSKSPAPIRPPKGSATSTPSLEDLDTDTYVATRMRELNKRR